MTDDGIRVDNNTSGASLGLNEIRDTDTGLLFNSGGINMGTQSHLGNTWQDGFPVWAAKHNTSDFLMSQFEINTDLLNCGSNLFLPNNFGAASVFPPSGWFINVPNECVENCTDEYDELNMAKVYEATANNEGSELGWSDAAK